MSSVCAPALSEHQTLLLYSKLSHSKGEFLTTPHPTAVGTDGCSAWTFGSVWSQLWLYSRRIKLTFSPCLHSLNNWLQNYISLWGIFDMDRFSTIWFPSGAQLCFLQANDEAVGAPHPRYLLWHTALWKGSLLSFGKKLYDGTKKSFLDTSSIKTCTLSYGSELLKQAFFRENVLTVMFKDILVSVLWIIWPSSTATLHWKCVRFGLRPRENSRSGHFCVSWVNFSGS